jgi:hypothetical protein
MNASKCFCQAELGLVVKAAVGIQADIPSNGSQGGQNIQFLVTALLNLPHKHLPLQ